MRGSEGGQGRGNRSTTRRSARALTDSPISANSAAAWTAVPRMCRPVGWSAGRPAGVVGAPAGWAGWRSRGGRRTVGRLAARVAGAGAGVGVAVTRFSRLLAGGRGRRGLGRAAGAGRLGRRRGALVAPAMGTATRQGAEHVRGALLAHRQTSWRTAEMAVAHASTTRVLGKSAQRLKPPLTVARIHSTVEACAPRRATPLRPVSIPAPAMPTAPSPPAHASRTQEFVDFKKYSV